jgi:hypothetical protein
VQLEHACGVWSVADSRTKTLDAAVIATLGQRVAHLAKVVDALQGS